MNIGGGLVRREYTFGLYNRGSTRGSYSWIPWSTSQSFAAIHHSRQLPWRASYASVEDVHSATHCFVAYLW